MTPCGELPAVVGSSLIRPRIKYGAGSAGTFSRREKGRMAEPFTDSRGLSLAIGVFPGYFS